MMYARMAWFVQQSLEGDVFRRGADWQRMKRGFQGLVAQYPASEWNRSAFAAFACLAGDEPVYRQLRRSLGERLRPEPFVYTANLPYCDHRWAVEKSVTPATLSSLRSKLRKSVRVLKRECKIANPKFVNPAVVRQLFDEILVARRTLAGVKREWTPDQTNDGPLLQDLEAADGNNVASICAAMRSS